MRQFLLVLVPVTALIAGCAAAPGATPGSGTNPARAEAPERQCFSPHQVDNFRTGESKGVSRFKNIGSTFFKGERIKESLVRISQIVESKIFLFFSKNQVAILNFS